MERNCVRERGKEGKGDEDVAEEGEKTRNSEMKSGDGVEEREKDGKGVWSGRGGMMERGVR